MRSGAAALSSRSLRLWSKGFNIVVESAIRHEFHGKVQSSIGLSDNVINLANIRASFGQIHVGTKFPQGSSIVPITKLLIQFLDCNRLEAAAQQ